MRFLLEQDAYFLRGENHQQFSVMVRSTNQQLFFHRSARVLFERAGEWTDLDEFVDSLHITSVPRERVRSDYLDTVIDLYVAGVAQIKDLPVSNRTGCFLAHKRDVLALSPFLTENMDRGFSCSASNSRNYYAKSPLQARIKDKLDTICYYEENGRILAALVLVFSDRNFGNRILTLQTVVVDGNLSEEQAEFCIGEVMRFIRLNIVKGLNKLRYEHIHERQDWIVHVLLKNGFTNTAVFPEELSTGQTLKLYDLFFESGPA